MNRLKFRKRIYFKKNRLGLFFVSLFFIIMFVIFSFRYLNYKISPIIMSYASLEAKNLSSIIMNKAISKHITEKISAEDMFTITKDDSGEIRMVDFNTPLINKFLTETTNSVQINLRNIEKGNVDALEFSDSVLINYDKKKLESGIIYEVSSGVIIGNPILANVGPKIPVKISLVGDAVSSVSTNIKNYGINNALIEVYVNLKISEMVMLPFYDQKIEINTKVPVAMKVVTGTVPDYYANGLNQSTPSLVLPNNQS